MRGESDLGAHVVVVHSRIVLQLLDALVAQGELVPRLGDLKFEGRIPIYVFLCCRV